MKVKRHVDIKDIDTLKGNSRPVSRAGIVSKHEVKLPENYVMPNDAVRGVMPVFDKPIVKLHFSVEPSYQISQLAFVEPQHQEGVEEIVLKKAPALAYQDAFEFLNPDAIPTLNSYSRPRANPQKSSRPTTQQGMNSRPTTQQGIYSRPTTQQGMNSRPTTQQGLQLSRSSNEENFSLFGTTEPTTVSQVVVAAKVNGILLPTRQVPLPNIGTTVKVDRTPYNSIIPENYRPEPTKIAKTIRNKAELIDSHRRDVSPPSSPTMSSRPSTQQKKYTDVISMDELNKVPELDITGQGRGTTSPKVKMNVFQPDETMEDYSFETRAQKGGRRSPTLSRKPQVEFVPQDPKPAWKIGFTIPRKNESQRPHTAEPKLEESVEEPALTAMFSRYEVVRAHREQTRQMVIKAKSLIHAKVPKRREIIRPSSPIKAPLDIIEKTFVRMTPKVPEPKPALEIIMTDKQPKQGSKKAFRPPEKPEYQEPVNNVLYVTIEKKAENIPLTSVGSPRRGSKGPLPSAIPSPLVMPKMVLVPKHADVVKEQEKLGSEDELLDNKPDQASVEERFKFFRDFETLLEREASLQNDATSQLSKTELTVNPSHIGFLSEEQFVTFCWNAFVHIRWMEEAPVSDEPAQQIYEVMAETMSEDDRAERLVEVVKNLSRKHYVYLKALSGHLKRISQSFERETVAGISRIFAAAFFRQKCPKTNDIYVAPQFKFTNRIMEEAYEEDEEVDQKPKVQIPELGVLQVSESKNLLNLGLLQVSDSKNLLSLSRAGSTMDSSAVSSAISLSESDAANEMRESILEDGKAMLTFLEAGRSRKVSGTGMSASNSMNSSQIRNALESSIEVLAELPEEENEDDDTFEEMNQPIAINVPEFPSKRPGLSLKIDVLAGKTIKPLGPPTAMPMSAGPFFNGNVPPTPSSNRRQSIIPGIPSITNEELDPDEEFGWSGLDETALSFQILDEMGPLTPWSAALEMILVHWHEIFAPIEVVETKPKKHHREQ